MAELLRIHPDEHPVSIQLFGHDPGVMRSAASIVGRAGADLIDINMDAPSRKVCRAGAGAALLAHRPNWRSTSRKRRVEGARRPVTVKLRSGREPGDTSGLALAVRLVEEAGVAAIAFHPRSAAVRHTGAPDYGLVRQLAERLADTDARVIVSGGLATRPAGAPPTSAPAPTR